MASIATPPKAEDLSEVDAERLLGLFLLRLLSGQLEQLEHGSDST